MPSDASPKRPRGTKLKSKKPSLNPGTVGERDDLDDARSGGYDPSVAGDYLPDAAARRPEGVDAEMLEGDTCGEFCQDDYVRQLAAE
eukprot:2631563-Pyramimonas_sp.AAC.1